MKTGSEKRKISGLSYETTNRLSLLAGLVLAGVFVTTMAIPAISTDSISIDKVNHMNRLASNTIDFAFELDE